MRTDNIEQTDNEFDLPKLRPLTQTLHLSKSAVIAAAGFEDRTLALSQRLAASECFLGLVVYNDWARGNRVEQVTALYEEAGVSKADQFPLSYSPEDPDQFGDTLAKLLKHLSVRLVVLDISTMSRLMIMVALDVARELQLEVEIFYAEAEVYGPSEAEFNAAVEGDIARPSIQVYSGLGGVVRTRRLSSVALQGEPSALIAFMSMNEVLTQALINSISPSRLFLINGRPPNHGWRERATAWIHEELRGEWQADNKLSMYSGHLLPERVTSTLDYRETFDLLLSLYAMIAAEHRVVLAPTGSKMQVLGSYLAKGVHRDIHVEYPTPEGFLKTYSHGVGQCWFIHLGVLQHVLQNVRQRVFSTRHAIISKL